MSFNILIENTIVYRLYTNYSLLLTGTTLNILPSQDLQMKWPNFNVEDLVAKIQLSVSETRIYPSKTVR